MHDSIVSIDRKTFYDFRMNTNKLNCGYRIYRDDRDTIKKITAYCYDKFDQRHETELSEDAVVRFGKYYSLHERSGQEHNARHRISMTLKASSPHVHCLKNWRGGTLGEASPSPRTPRIWEVALSKLFFS